MQQQNNQQPNPNEFSNEELLQLMRGNPTESSDDMLSDEELFQLLQARIAIKDRIIREAGWQAEKEEGSKDSAFQTVLRQWLQEDLRHALYLDKQHQQAYVLECRHLMPYGGSSEDDFEFRYTPIVQISEEDIRMLTGG